MTNDLLRNDAVYHTMPPDQLLKLMGVLDHSYQFARMFNDDKDLRTGLWKVGESTFSLTYFQGKESPRLYEAPAQSPETRIQQCINPGACATQDVF